METIRVYIERVVYQDDSNGFQILLGTSDDEEKTLLGKFMGQMQGLTIEATGTEEYNPARGPQFRVSSYEVIEPEDEEGIRRYLASGAIKGVGDSIAARIVEKFGADAMRIIEEEPERLAQIKGISMRKAQEIAVQVEQQKDLQSAMIFLQKYGITFHQAVKIYDRYGNRIYSILKENPYLLAREVDGIGFQTADSIANKIGIKVDSEYRIHCGILYELSKAMGEGHTYVPMEVLIGRSSYLLGIDKDEVEPHLNNLLVEKDIVIKSGQVYTAAAYRAESEVAFLLRQLRENDFSNEDPSREKKIAELEAESGIVLDPRQKKAVLDCAVSGIFLLTGGPGTGKTTTINTIIRYFLGQGKNIALAAPTGRAAKRMTEATGYEAKTIHRLLEVGAAVDNEMAIFGRDEENPLEEDVVIIDEMSMVDIFLFRALLRAVDIGKRLILVGDMNQLPSVGPGQVLRDMVLSDTFKTVELETIFRQEDGSDIVSNAHTIKEGGMVKLDNNSKDFYFLSRTDTNVIYNNVIQLVTDKLPRYVKKQPYEIQVMTPMRKGPLGVEQLNQILQKYLNPPKDDLPEHTFGEKRLRVGDKVMQMKNNYKLEWRVLGYSKIEIAEGTGVFNGDVGIIRQIREYDKVVQVEFDDGKIVDYPFGSVDELELAYAITVHKSQGSEYEAVVLVLHTVPKLLTYRNLLYTAVTRAKRCVTLIGTQETIADMIANEKGQERFTGLLYRIRESAF